MQRLLPLAKYNKKNAKKLNNFPRFSPLLDKVNANLGSLNTQLTGVAFTYSKWQFKLATKSNNALIYYQPKGLLYYNENGAGKKFGRGGVIATFRKRTQLTSSNFDITERNSAIPTNNKPVINEKVKNNTLPTYTLTLSPLIVNEGDTIKATLKSSELKSGPILYGAIAGASSADIFGSSSDTIYTDSKGIGTKDIRTTSDNLTEGDEQITYKVYSDKQRTKLVATSNPITIKDTSKTPANSSYSISTSSLQVDEGDTLPISIKYSNVKPGSKIYSTISGINTSDVKNTINGSFTANSTGSTSVAIYTINDKLTEGDEIFTYRLYSDSQRSKLVATSNPITIKDTSTTEKSYSATASNTEVNEGKSVGITLRTKNIKPGTYVYDNISGISSADIKGELSGRVKIGSYGYTSFTVDTLADQLTEGDETFTYKLYSDPQRTNLVATSAPITIKDTSKAPLKPSYSISISPSEVNEGDTIKILVKTRNLPGSSSYFYSSITGINDSDVNGRLENRVPLRSGGSTSISLATVADELTEGDETFTYKLYSDSQRKNLLASSSPVTIKDTSKTLVPSYSISASSTAVNEGSKLDIDIKFSNIKSRTYLYGAISGVSSSDISGGLTKRFWVNGSGEGSIPVEILADSLTEGNETFTYKVYSDPQRKNLIATTKPITINDTSKTPSYSLSASTSEINEGDSFKISIKYSNVKANTNLYGKISGVSSSDISGWLTNSFKLSGDGSGYFTFKTIADKTTEGNEFFTYKLYSDSARTNLLAASDPILIRDTSVTPTPAPSPTPSPTPSPAPTPSPSPSLNLSTARSEVIRLTNLERTRRGLNPLSFDPILGSAAQAHSDWMATNNRYGYNNDGHTGKNGSSPFDRMKSAGYSYSRAAENVAAGQRTAAAVVDGWMNSPGHRRNILTPSLEEIGVGVAVNDASDYYIYWTQKFGTPI